jgi:SagB-type dehydrogenase family enzyme
MWGDKPRLVQPAEPAASDPVALRKPEEIADVSFWDALAKRRSERDYSGNPLTIGELSRLVWAAQGITGTAGGYRLRAAPSAGALYPIETYLVVNNVGDVPHGVYRYDVLRTELVPVRLGDYRQAVCAAALDQGMAYDAAVVFIWTAVIARSLGKYKERAYRYIFLDAGHIGQNVSLAATAMGLGCCMIAALFDDEVNALVGADGENEFAVYMATVGSSQ